MPSIIGSITDLLGFFTNLLTWWVVISPWNEAVRVRLGKHVAVLKGGVHLRIPFVDLVYEQSVRTRVLHLATQTVVSKDGKALTLGATIGYSIVDILKLYQTLHSPESTLTNLAASVIAAVVNESLAQDLSPNDISKAATARLNFEQYGLAISTGVQITDYAFVRTYRIIQDTRYSSAEGLSVGTVR